MASHNLKGITTADGVHVENVLSTRQPRAADFKHGERDASSLNDGYVMSPYQDMGGLMRIGYASIALALIVLAIRVNRRRLLQAIGILERLEPEVAMPIRDLREANRQLVIAGEAKTNFLACTTHELRTPMTGVKDLLDLSKAPVGKIAIESIPIDMTQLVEECAALFVGTAESKGLELIVCPPWTDEDALLADPLRIRQILLSLIRNAAKFTERGEIIIRCDIEHSSRDCADVTLSVTDTGIGMSEATISRIFAPFAQADETTTRRFGGTGLSLSICAELLKLMGGSISVESHLGAGSTFKVKLRLPRAARARRAPPRYSGTASIVTTRPAMREALRRHAARFNLLVAGIECSGQIARPNVADVVFVDVDRCINLKEAVSEFGFQQHATMILIAGTAAIDRLNLEALACRKHIVRKPFYRDMLEDVLAAVFDAVPHAEPAPAQMPMRTETRAVDLAIVSRLRTAKSADQRDLYPQLVSLFQENAQSELDAISRALGLQDLSTIHALSHKLKGAAYNVGASVFAGSLGDLERACADGDLVQAQQIHAVLTAQYPRLIADLVSLSLRASA